ncbi:MAG: hypothetical protein PUC88_01205 [Clostridia bacterium]|nr:hypothetical protein [Clostridia bacterium]
MKLKSSWIVFIPTFLSALGIQMFQSISGVNSFGFMIAGVAVTLLMVLGIIIIACNDRYTVREYEPRKNFASGILLCIVAVASAFYGVTGISHIFDEKLEILKILLAVSALLSSIVFVLLGINAFTGNYTVTASPVMTLAPVLMFAIELINRFISYTTVAVASTQVYDILSVVFLLIFMFYCASIYAGIPTKQSVKCCFIFGMPGITLTFMWCIKDFMPILSGKAPFVFNDRIPEFIAFSFALFALSFLLEITLNAKIAGNFTLDDDEDFSSEEEYFGLTRTRKEKEKSSYESIVKYAKNNRTNSYSTQDAVENTVSDELKDKNTTPTHNNQNNASLFDESVRAGSTPSVDSSSKPVEYETDDGEEDLSWIDKLIKDIEEEQNQ